MDRDTMDRKRRKKEKREREEEAIAERKKN